MCTFSEFCSYKHEVRNESPVTKEKEAFEIKIVTLEKTVETMKDINQYLANRIQQIDSDKLEGFDKSNESYVYEDDPLDYLNFIDEDQN